MQATARFVSIWGKDRFIYLEPKCMIPDTQHPNAATIIQRAKKGLQTKADFDLFRIEEIDYNDLDDEIKKRLLTPTESANLKIIPRTTTDS